MSMIKNIGSSRNNREILPKENNNNFLKSFCFQDFFSKASQLFIITLIIFCVLIPNAQGEDIKESELANSGLSNTTDNQFCSSANTQVRRFILLVGATETGKSSFINTILNSQSKLTEKSRNSVTKSVEMINAGSSQILYPDDPSDSILYLIDTPGFFFNDSSLQNDKILQDIKDAFGCINTDSLDAVLIFGSATSDFYSLPISLLLLMKTFGEKITLSSLGITTKWDLLISPYEIDLATLSYKSPFITLVDWINDNGKQSLTQIQKSNQILKLSNSLKSIVPYKLQNLCTYNNYLTSTALNIQSNGTNRYISKTITVPQVTNTSFVESSNKTSCKLLYTTADLIDQRALSLQNASKTHTVKKTRSVTLNTTQIILIQEARYANIDICNGTNCLKLLDTRKYCIEHFIALKYDGNGGIYIAGAESNSLVHTSRTDCGDYYQGWVKVFSFDKQNKAYMNINTVGIGYEITCKGSVTWNTNIESSTIFTDCAWGMSGAQFPDITVNITVFSVSGELESKMLLSDYRQYCIGNFIAVKYDGINSIFVGGAESSQLVHRKKLNLMLFYIHKARSNCVTFYQGWLKIMDFNATGLTNFTISHEGADTNLTCRGSSNFEVNKTKTIIYTDCAWYFGGAQFPYIKVNFIANITNTTSAKAFLSDNRQHCIDYYIALKYDGNGCLYLSGADSNQQIQTTRNDCKNFNQNWTQIHEFNIVGISNVSISFSGTSNNKTCNGSANWRAYENNTQVFTNCFWNISGAQYPFIMVNVSLLPIGELSTVNFFNDSRKYCIDHFIAIKYDGVGGVYIAGAEPDKLIHTKRSDCGTYFQGWVKTIEFDTLNAETLYISHSGSDLGLTCSGTLNWNAKKENMTIFTDCSWSSGGAQFPLIYLNVTVTRSVQTCKAPEIYYSQIPYTVNFTYQTLEEYDANDYYPIEVYKEMAAIERSEVNTTVQETKYRVNVTMVNQTVEVERNDFSYYIEIAKNQMMDTYRKQIIK
ncbi:hypothetical protein SteCoe_12728 [Stentor coeruleus]|uniref:AIG1-type G domain-containing protein n=1 Tax=Stentor coeruleus TaxID=5963 RepID=A0A1R2CA80_9CILI|nr:hypothetical protein SteCoe_12728 [Stentor coeruleus]